MNSIDNLLNNIDMNMSHVDNLENKLFDVKLVQLHPNLEGFDSPQNFGVYKANGGSPLGVVGKNYEPMQPKAIFNQFKDGLIENGMDLSKMKYSEYKGGSKINFSLPVGQIGFKNILGQDDESILYLNMQTGFDGLTKTTLFLSMVRLVCTNGMKAMQTEYTIAFKNTKGNSYKVNYFAEQIKNVTAQETKLTNLIQRLNNVPITQAKIDEFLLATTGHNRKTINEASTRARNIFDDINRAVGIELNRTGNTLWGLVNGITYYTNHLQTNKEVDESIMIGAGLKMNTKAQEQALFMAAN